MSEVTDKTDSKKIVWLASYPKSGNTWTRCFLDAYFLGDVDLNELLTTVSDDLAAAHQIGDGSDITEHRFEIQQLTRPMSLLRQVKQYLSTSKEIPFFMKTHNANLLINGTELIPEVLTKATIVIIRDPRDVLPSFSSHMGVDLDQGLEWLQDKYRMLGGKGKTIDFISSWKDHTQSWLNCDTHNIKYFLYEDLQKEPVKYFSKILEHAGIEPDEDRVIKALEMIKLERLKNKEAKEGFGEQSPYSKQFFGAKHETPTPKQLHAITKDCSRVLKRLGYEASRISKVA